MISSIAFARDVKKRYSLHPSLEIDGRWVEAVKDSIKSFSAVGYFFAKKLHNTIDVPIGIIMLVGVVLMWSPG